MRFLLIPILLGGCATVQPPSAVRTLEVRAVGETTAVMSLDDAADDPAIWHNPRNGAASLIVATDKKAGLNVYGIDGKLRSTFPAGRVNNVDLRVVGKRIVVAASDRNDVANAKLALFELDPITARLRKLARVDAGSGEAYGLCLYQPRRGRLSAFVVMKGGRIAQIEVAPDGGSAAIVRSMVLKTQSEGCVVDDRTGQLYVGEEAVGIWRFGAKASDPIEAMPVAMVDGQRLVADVEGLAIAPQGRRGGYLIASSQGDNAYVLWRLPLLTYVGRFRISPGTFGATSETDGIEVSARSFPGYPGGMFVAQDGDNSPAAQNFKLVRWADIRRAMQRRR